MFEGSFWFGAIHLGADNTLQNLLPMFASPGGGFLFCWCAVFSKMVTHWENKARCSSSGSAAPKTTTGKLGPAGRLAHITLDFHLHYAHPQTEWFFMSVHFCDVHLTADRVAACLEFHLLVLLKFPADLVTQLDLIWDQAEAINTHSVLHSPYTFKSS